jgi:hypothetical protein
MNFTLDKILLLVAAALVLASGLALWWGWRQKEESDHRLKLARRRVEEAEAKLQTDRQALEAKARKLEAQESEFRRAQSAPREPTAPAKKNAGRSYRQEFDTSEDNGDKTHAHAAGGRLAAVAPTAAVAAESGSADGRSAADVKRLEKDREDLAAAREKLAQEQAGFERRIAEESNRFERELQLRYKGEMEQAAEQISQASQARAAATQELARIAEEKQRLETARKALAEAKTRIEDLKTRVEESGLAQERTRAALEEKQRVIERLTQEFEARQREIEQRNDETQKRLDVTRSVMDRREQALTRRDASLKSLEADLQSRQAAFVACQQEVENKESQNRARAQELTAEAQRLSAVEAAAQARYREGEERDRQAQTARLAAGQLAREAAQDQADAAKARKTAEEQRERAAQDLAATQRHRDEIECVRQTFWPDGFRTGPLAQWQARLEKAVADGDADARMLLSFIHVYHAADAAAADPKNLRDALKEISRYLFKHLARTAGAPEGAKLGHLWAEELNKFGKGRFSIQLPSVGDPIDANWMIRPSNNAQAVSTVITWAVRDAKGIATHRAEVA